MEPFVRAVLIVCLLHVPNVAAFSSGSSSDIIGMAVAGACSLILFSIILGIIFLSCRWKNWYNDWMTKRGKVRVPKTYSKSTAAKRRLASKSEPSNSYDLNERVPTESVYEAGVQGKSRDDWPHEAVNGPANRVYEEKDATVMLGEEGDTDNESEMYTIETEVLDQDGSLGGSSIRRATSIKRGYVNVIHTDDPHLYSNSFKLKVKKGEEDDSKIPEATSENFVEPEADYGSDPDEKVTSFNGTTVHL